MLKIRTFQPQDAEPVRHLFAQGQLDFAAGITETIQAYIQESLADDLSDIPANYLRQSGSHFWVAEIAGLIKGIVGIQRRSNHEAELRRMSVSADSRRQGIGWKLLETTEAFCRSNGYHHIRLTTVTHLQPAIAMYLRFGYHLTEEEQFGQIMGQHFIKRLVDDPVELL